MAEVEELRLKEQGLEELELELELELEELELSRRNL